MNENRNFNRAEYDEACWMYRYMARLSGQLIDIEYGSLEYHEAHAEIIRLREDIKALPFELLLSARYDRYIDADIFDPYLSGSWSFRHGARAGYHKLVAGLKIDDIPF